MAPTLPPPVDSTNTLFPHTLISSEVTASLPAGFTIRPLVRDDHARGFYECLKVLTWVGGDGDGQPSAAEFRTRFDEMAAAAGTYYFLVIEWEGRVVGTGELVVEKKLYVFFFSLPLSPPPSSLSLSSFSVFLFLFRVGGYDICVFPAHPPLFCFSIDKPLGAMNDPPPSLYT